MWLIFDMDGVILNSQNVKLQAYWNFISNNNLDIKLKDEDILKSKKPSDIFLDIMPNFNSQYPNLIKEYKKLLSLATRFISDEELKELGMNFKLALFTSQKRDSINIIFPDLSLFDKIVTAEDINHTLKENSNGIEEILTSSKDKIAFFIGDTDDDIKAAKKNGIQSIFVSWGYTQKENLEEKPDFIVNTKEELFELINSQKPLQIGCCTNIKDKEFILSKGFDYVELKANDLSLKTSDKNIRFVNSFLPRNLSLYKKSDLDELKKIAKEVIHNCKNSGIKIITFGSGKTRRIRSDTISPEEETIWSDFLHFLDDLAGQNDLKISLEPLTIKETNFINTVEEAVFWIEKFKLKNFGLTLDSYHFYEMQDSLKDIEKYRNYIIHAHIADENQSVPLAISSKLKEFILFVKSLGCDLSLEMVPYDLDSISDNFVRSIKEVINNE